LQKGQVEEKEKEKPKVSTTLPLCELSKLSGQDLPSFLTRYASFLRLSGLQPADDQTQTDWLIQACDSNIYEIVEKIVEEAHADLEFVLTRIGNVFLPWKMISPFAKKLRPYPH